MSRLVEAARSFLGVPFKHRGRSRRGLDCAGLVWCACAEVGVIHPDLKRYGREPHRDGMMRVVIEGAGEPVWQGAPGQVVPRELLEVGDVVVMRFVKEPHHMGILGTDRFRGLSLIHANAQIDDAQGPRVVEHGLDDLWQSRICAVFRGAA